MSVFATTSFNTDTNHPHPVPTEEYTSHTSDQPSATQSQHHRQQKPGLHGRPHVDSHESHSAAPRRRIPSSQVKIGGKFLKSTNLRDIPFPHLPPPKSPHCCPILVTPRVRLILRETKTPSRILHSREMDRPKARKPYRISPPLGMSRKQKVGAFHSSNQSKCRLCTLRKEAEALAIADLS